MTKAFDSLNVHVLWYNISYKRQYRQDCLRCIQNKQTNNLNFGHSHWTKN